MNNPSQGAMTVTELDVIKSFINNTFLIDFGVIKEVLETDGKFNGIVRVAVSVAKSVNDVAVLTCPLAVFATGTFGVKTVPKVDDKVIVLYPRRYVSEMFSEKNNDFLICNNSTGYNMYAGIAFLANQFRKEKYTDFFEVTDEGMKLTFGYDTENDACDSAIQIGKNGTLSVAKYSDGEEKSNISITLADAGITMQDKNGCKIETSSEYLTINGKLKVKK